MKIFLPASIFWFPLAIAHTLISGIIYLAGQLIYRQEASDPQYQMAEDAADAITRGAHPQSVVLEPTVDLNSNLSPYLIVCDEQKNPVTTTVMFNGQVPGCLQESFHL